MASLVDGVYARTVDAANIVATRVVVAGVVASVGDGDVPAVGSIGVAAQKVMHVRVRVAMRVMAE